MKKLVAVVVALVASLSLTVSAQAANETVEGTTELTPRSGQFFQAKPLPANMMIRADVTTPASSPLVNPLKNTHFTFPKGTSFNPKKSMPVCTDKMLSVDSTLNDPAGVIDACPDSIIGTGTATIILAKVNNNPNTVIDDPVLVLFNYGTSKQGPKIKIWGYSKYTNVGILMHGTLKKGILDVAVPVLSSDSAVRYFQFDMPGPVLDRTEELGIKVQGQDPTYVKAYCPASGKLVTKSKFILGERDPSTYMDTTPSVTVASPDTTQECTGKPGKAKLKVKVKGPKAVKKGKKGAFKVTISNTGTGLAKGVKVTGTGGAKGSAGNVFPEQSKTITVRAKVTGKKGKKKTLAFTAKGGATAKGKVKVKIK